MTNLKRVLKQTLSLEFVLVAIFFVGLRLPSWFSEHIEGDERVYLALAEQLHKAPSSYSLQGHPLLESYDSAIYDRALFHHPPLLVWLVYLFKYFISDHSVLLISWLAHFSIILSLFVMCKRSGKNEASSPVLSAVFLWALFDPLLTFVSLRIWTEGLLAALIFGVLTSFQVGLEKASRRKKYWIFSGIFLGLSILTKIQAMMIIVPLAMGALWQWKKLRDPQILKDGIRLSLIAGIICTPWFLRFYYEYGTFMPEGVKPTAALIASNAFIRNVVSRPWYFFLVEWPLSCPIILGLMGIQFRFRSGTCLVEVVNWLWILLVLTVMSLMASFGFGFQLRFLAMGVPSIYLIMHSLERRLPALSIDQASLYSTLLFLLFAFNAASCVLYALGAAGDDPRANLLLFLMGK